MKEKFYGRDGKPLRGGLLQWAKLMEDVTYRVVSQTALENGIIVSTVWLGIDHSFQFPPITPIIFETMVFSAEKHKSELFGREFREDLDCVRYATETEALIGHNKMVQKWKGITEKWKRLDEPVKGSRDRSRRSHLN